MRPLSEMTIIQIEVTNACWLKCSNCTRHVGHHKNPFFMELDYIEKAIDSLEGFEGNIGIMGGEPTLHPKFDEICKLVQKKIPRRKREFWTSGFQWAKKKDIILETWDKDRIAYNEHSTPGGKHTPLLVSIDEVVEDKKLMWQMIDNCWIQSQWSASITPKGGFFCEVAASLDYLLDGPGGYEIEKILVYDGLCKISDLKILKDIEIVEISKEIFEKLSYRKSFDGLLALANKKKHSLFNLRISDNPLILVVENIEKPGNLGAVLRTCDAAKIDAVLIADQLSKLMRKIKARQMS